MTVVLNRNGGTNKAANTLHLAPRYLPSMMSELHSESY